MKSVLKQIKGKERNCPHYGAGYNQRNGSSVQRSGKWTIPKVLWDAIENKAKGKNMEAREPNFVLDNIKAQIIKDYQRISRP